MSEIKENDRIVIVGHRRSGKTTKIISMCLDKIEEGVDVLYAANNVQMWNRFTKDMIILEYMNRCRGEVPIYTVSEKRLTFPNGSSLYFRTLGQISGENQSRFRIGDFSNYFKVYDEECWNTLYFDVISVTGESKEVV